MTMADKIVVMQDGLVEQIGTPLELYDTPANLFVAGFIGSPAMNFIKGKVRLDGAYSVEAEGARLPFWGDRPVTEGQEVVYGIRPEHLELADDGFQATVDVVEPTGSETMVFLHVGSESIVALFRERHDFKPGQTVRLRPKPASAHLFDAQSGKRL